MEIKIEKLKTGLYMVDISEGCQRGDQQSYAHKGMMYNTYLRDTGRGYFLFGTPPVKFVEEWLEALQQITELSEIRWAAVFGMEHEFVCVQRLLEKNPELTIVAGAGAKHRIEGAPEEKTNVLEIRGTRRLQFGNICLEFKIFQDKFETPSLYCLDREAEVLLETDILGAVGRMGESRLSRLEHKEVFFEGLRKYRFDIGGIEREAVFEQVYDYVQKEKVIMICPGYGPVIDESFEQVLLSWKSEKRDQKKPVLAIVHTDGKYVRELAEAIESGAKETGDIDVWKFCSTEDSRENILEKLGDADAVLFGDSDKDGDVSHTIWSIAAGQKRSKCTGKTAAVFGWGASGGDYTESLKQRLSWMGYSLTVSDFVIQERPYPDSLKRAYEYGFDMRCILLHIPNPRKPKLVRCEVCGEIFDASLGTCPVCGVGLEQCTPVDEDVTAFRNDTKCSYVIIGGGIAAVSAAEAIRQRDHTGTIMVLSAENSLPINRPMLTKDIWTAGIHPEELLVHSREWYEEKRITIKTECKVTAIHVQEKSVETEKGVRVHYDKLIYAAGAECFVPPFKGKEKPEVLTIRHLQDSKRLVNLIKKGKNAVVIGGGVLGLEAANELIRSNMHVTVLEAAPQIIGRQIDRRSADILKSIMKKMNVACYEGVSIEEIEGDGHVTGVRLADGTVFPADFVVVSCGNRGNIQMAKEAGIETERSIVVNSKMETSEKDIYACGDCAQMDGLNYQLWAEASSQGKIAGANAAGEAVDYVGQMYGLSMEGFGTSVFALGDLGRRGEVRYRKAEIHDEIAKKEKTFWFSGCLLEGAVLIGCQEEIADVSRWVSTHARYDDIF